jgi:hypothetical protein
MMLHGRLSGLPNKVYHWHGPIEVRQACNRLDGLVARTGSMLVGGIDTVTVVFLCDSLTFYTLHTRL